MHKLLALFATLLILSSCSQKTQPERLRFVVMGGVHFRPSDVRGFLQTIQKIKEYKPEFVLFLGGTVDSFANDPMENNRIWQIFDKAVEKLGVPVYDVVGWGEIPSILLKEQVLKPYLDRYKSLYYSFAYRNNLFICLDSESNNEHFGPEQIAFIKGQIAGADKYDNIFVATHEVALDTRTPARANWLKDIHPLLRKKVSHVFSSSGPGFSQQMIDRVRYLSTESEESHADVVFFPHFLLVDAHKKLVSVSVVPAKALPVEKFKYRRKKQSRDARDVRANIKRLLLDSPARRTLLKPSEVVAAMDIKPEMVVADVGAGTGLFTFPLAESLKGTGKVYATSPDKEMLKVLQQKVREKKTSNVIPVAISAAGLDPFYKQLALDRVLLSEVYQTLDKPWEYFEQLRPSLKEDGRVFIVHFRTISNFSVLEFGTFEHAMRTLASNGVEFPFNKRFGPDVQAYLLDPKNRSSKVPPPKIQQAFIRDFNRMLADSTLYSELVTFFASDKSLWPSPLDRFIVKDKAALVRWLVVGLDQAGALDTPAGQLKAEDGRRLKMLNRIIITSLFASEEIADLQGSNIWVEESSIVSSMKRAGFQFVREHGMLTYHHVLEFKKE